MSRPGEVGIRRAVVEDLPEILRIYNEAVATTTATFDVEPRTLEDRRAWLLGRAPQHPVVVLEMAAGGGKNTLLGWASLSPWAERVGYRITAEPSIYLDAPARGKGFGRVLMGWVVAEADRHGFRSVISRIDAENVLSIELHRKFGFREVGVLPEVGTKFGRLLDVVLLQRMNPTFDPARLT